MKKRTKEYWRGRFEQLEKASNQNAQNTYSQIEDVFFQTQREIENKINNWYVRFTKNNKISMSEAKKLLNSDELKEFKWDVQEYIKYGRENKLNGKWIKELENASARFHISRLESLKIQTQQSLEKLFGNQLDHVDKMVSKGYTNNYYHTIFEIQKGFNVGFRIGTIDENKLSKIVSKPWAIDGVNFSERIWGKKTTLINELHKQLSNMCIQGKAPDSVIKYMSKKFNTSKAQAGNLVMTENAYFSELARKDCFNDLDIERYEIVATLDLHTSNICQEQDGKIHNMKDYETGVTAPPFHNFCRSTTAPYFDDDYDIKDTRIARGEDGKTYEVPADMNYKEWKEKYVTNSNRSSIIDKNVAISNKSDSINKSEIIKSLKELKIEHNPVQKLKSTLSNDEIIQKIGGGDITEGSCSSLSFAYIANKNGLDVLDFRGGASQKFFSKISNICKIAKLPGVKSHIEENFNDIMGTMNLLKAVEDGKEYYLATGKHATIIKKIEKRYQYLELQSSKENGFKILTSERLKKRFGCKQSHSVAGHKLKTKNILIDIDSLRNNSEFEEILGYLNTQYDKQMKGMSGYAK